MKVTTDNNEHYLVTGPATSIFTSRNGKKDCTVWKMSETSGVLMQDGNRYKSIARFSFETGEVLRQYNKLPKEITIKILARNGFIDHVV